MRRFIALALALALAVPVAAEKEKGADARVRAVAPFLDAETVAVGHADLGRIDLDALAGRLRQSGKLPAKDVAQFRQEAGKAVDTLKKAGVRDLYLVASLADLSNRPGVVLVAPLGGGADPEAVAKALHQVLHLHAERVGEAVVAGEKDALQRLRDLKPAPHPELAKALAAAGNGAAQMVVLLPQHLRRALEEAMPNLPPQAGGGSIKTVTRGLSWVAVGVNLTPKLAVRATVQAKDAEAARKLGELHDNLLQALTTALAKDKEAQEIFPRADALRELFTPKAAGSRLTLALDDRELTSVLLPAVAKVRGAAARTQSMNNLRQMALAMHNYHDTYKAFPSHASYDKQGRPLLSWRVQILPFIEHQNLYQEFHLDEAWDSPHNKKLIARMPVVYRSPLAKAGPGKTTYLVVVGKDTMFPPGDKGVQVRDVTDGLSQTLLIVEADDGHAVPWTKPEDLRFNPQDPFQGLGGKATGRFLAAFADGSVRVISRTINAADLRALFTRNGGEVINNIP
jgi:hypothetical protein